MPVGGQRFDEAVLDDVFGQMVIAQALSSKGDEHLEILENCIFNASHRGSVARVGWWVTFESEGSFNARTRRRKGARLFAICALRFRSKIR